MEEFCGHYMNKCYPSMAKVITGTSFAITIEDHTEAVENRRVLTRIAQELFTFEMPRGFLFHLYSIT